MCKDRRATRRGQGQRGEGRGGGEDLGLAGFLLGTVDVLAALILSRGRGRRICIYLWALGVAFGVAHLSRLRQSGMSDRGVGLKLGVTGVTPLAIMSISNPKY